MRTNKNCVFYIFTFAIFLGLAVPTLFSDGMFMDGLIYAGISKNMSLGIGTFWKPHLSETLFPQFYEHPPFALGLESLWFSLFDESILVERLYSLTTFIIVGFLIVAIWKEITNDIKTAWMPLLFWAILPDTTWAVSNNMLENTMSVFVALSVLLYLKGFSKHRFIFLLLSGISLFFALFSKGFTCLYVWSFPFFIWIMIRKRNFANMLIDSVLLILITVLPVFILYKISAGAAENMNRYFENQVLGSIENVKTVDTRFAIVGFFFNGILPSIGIGIITLIVAYKKKIKMDLFFTHYRFIAVFFLLSLAGVLPIMVSMKQRSFYLITVYPFASIALAMFILPVFKELTKKLDYSSRSFRIFSYISYSLLGISLILSGIQTNIIGRDENIIKDCYLVIDKISENNKINICPEMSGEWSLHGYFARYGNISLDFNPEASNEYYLTQNDCSNPNLEQNYEVVDIEGIQEYKLFKKK